MLIRLIRLFSYSSAIFFSVAAIADEIDPRLQARFDRELEYFGTRKHEEVWIKANQGDAEAQNRMGESYASVLDLDNDYKVAFKWFTKAVEQDHSEAQYNLADLYAFGQGIPTNDQMAFNLYLKSAKQGNDDAQFEVGYYYDKGLGVSQDKGRSYAWYSIVKANNKSEVRTDAAKSHMERIREEMTKQQLTEAQTLAAKCYESNYKDCD